MRKIRIKKWAALFTFMCLSMVAAMPCFAIDVIYLHDWRGAAFWNPFPFTLYASWHNSGYPNISDSGGNRYFLGIRSNTNRSFNVSSNGNVLNYWFVYGNPANVDLSGFIDLSSGGQLRSVGGRGFNYSGGRLRVFSGSGQITIDGNAFFTNSGRIELYGGLINGGGGAFWNNGTVDASGNTSVGSTQVFNQPNATWKLKGGNYRQNTRAFVNNGLLQIESGRNFSGNAFLQNNGTIRILNGSITGSGGFRNDGTLSMTSATVNKSGTFRNFGSISMSNSTLTIPSSKQIAGPIIITGNGCTINGSAFTSTRDFTVNNNVTFNTTINMGFRNINVGTNARLNVRDRLSMTGGFVINSRAIVTVSTGSGDINSSNVGTISNYGTLNSSTSSNVIRAFRVDNLGSMTLNGSMFTSSSFYSSGTFRQNAGTLGTGSFRNDGNAIIAGSTLFQPSGTTDNRNALTFNGSATCNGSINNTGGAFIDFNGTHTISGSRTLTNSGTSTRIIIDGTVTCNGAINNAAGRLIINGTINNGNITNNDRTEIAGNVGGNGIFTNSTSGLVTQSSGTFSKALTNNGTTTFNGGSLTSSSFTQASTGNTTFNNGTTFGGTVSNSGLLVFNGGSTMSGTINAQSNSLIYINAAVTQSGPITGAGGNTGTSLIINQSSTGTQTAGNTITDIRSILVQAGVFSSAFNITGVNTAFSVASGASAVFSAILNGTGTLGNSGTVTFNAGSSLTSFTSITKGSGSVTNFSSSGNFDLNGTNIFGTLSTPVGLININNTTNLRTNAAINLVKTISIANASTLTLQRGSSCTNFEDIILSEGSNLVVQNGASLTVSNANTVSGSGNIDNSGFFTVDGANLTLTRDGGTGGDFINNSTGIFYILGVPNITLGGDTFTNQGSLFAAFSTSNSLPKINASSANNVNLNNGTIVVGYNNNYIANGSYTLITSNANLTSGDLGGVVLPQPSRYIRSFSLTTNGPNVNITVERDGFSNHALNKRATDIGAFLEFIGSNAPNQSQIDLLNALEKTTTDQELTAALLSLIPSEAPPLQTMAMISANLRPVEVRLPSLRGSSLLMVAAGDDDLYGTHGAWVRPFSSSGNQRDRGELQGYKSRTNGFVLGFDTEVQTWLTAGIAGSFSKSTVTQSANSLSFTDISAYQAMIYGTFSFESDSYLDWIIAVGNNNYDGNRNVSLTGFEANAVSDYGGQQVTVKAIASKDFVIWDYYQFTPQASAQYSFLRTLGYQEQGAGPYNIMVNPSNQNLFRLGIGSEVSMPFSSRNTVAIPAFHVGAFVDAQGGAQDTNSMFFGGSPILSAKVSQSRLMMRLGASLTVAFSDNIEATFNYDFEGRRGYTGQEAFLNLRYIF